MKMVKIIIIILFFIKLMFFLRIFETFSFLVSMLQDVFSDLSAFMGFFMMAVVIFSCLIQVLLPETKVNYDGWGYFSYIVHFGLWYQYLYQATEDYDSHHEEAHECT